MRDVEPKPEDAGEPKVRRWREQRWIVDNIIQANTLDWDQPRSHYLAAACGVEALADFAAIRQNVKKYEDIEPAFVATARRREAIAEAAEAEHRFVTARDNYFMAAIHWGASQWTLHQNNEINLHHNGRKRECYRRYARLADHRIEEVQIPFAGRTIPGWFHLPPTYAGGRLPVVISFPGMDTYKEVFVALKGDRWLSRGIAVLAVDGPGQAEARVLGVTVTMENWTRVGKHIVDWLENRPEIDPTRIGAFGNSFGSFFVTIVTANEPRIRACVANSNNLEPGFHSIFEEATPSYKKRFMYMAGILDEPTFDAFRKTLTWEGHAERIEVPYLCVAGEADELSPLIHSERMLSRMKAPRQLVVYEGSRHALGACPSTSLGPHPPTLVADWMAARLAGEPFASERWFVTSSGTIAKSPL